MCMAMLSQQGLGVAVSWHEGSPVIPIPCPPVLKKKYIYIFLVKDINK